MATNVGHRRAYGFEPTSNEERACEYYTDSNEELAAMEERTGTRLETAISVVLRLRVETTRTCVV